MGDYTLEGPLPKVLACEAMLKANLNSKLEEIRTEVGSLYSDVGMIDVPDTRYFEGPREGLCEAFPSLAIFSPRGYRDHNEGPPSIGDVAPVYYPIDIFIYIYHDDSLRSLVRQAYGYGRAVDELIYEFPRFDGSSNYLHSAVVMDLDYGSLFMDEDNRFYGTVEIHLSTFNTA